MNEQQTTITIGHRDTRRYILEAAPVGEGGQGTIYTATEQPFTRKVCVKRMSVPGDTSPMRIQNARRMQTEAMALLCLDDAHIHVPQLYDCWYDDTDHYLNIVMQRIPGHSLEEMLTQAESGGQRACDVIGGSRILCWMMDLCEILRVMELSYIYHKDIKPANLIIDQNGHLWLIDFGISIAAANLVEGTAGYRAPEMETGSRYTDRSKVDMFAIGVILYRCYTGRIPTQPTDYVKPAIRGTAWMTYHAPIEYNPGMPTAVNDIITRCMQYHPSMRYRNADQLRNALRSAVRSSDHGRHQ